MSVQISCSTTFDITPTGIRSYFKPASVPCHDSTGREIFDFASWQRARNQQRNWETVNQIISMRALASNISTPEILVTQKQKIWQFEFEINQAAQISFDHDDVYWLKQDAQGVPMIIGLDEGPQKTCVIDTQGADCNVWFSVVSHK